MILTGPEIIKEREAGRIHIEPFNPAHVGPNSYDLSLDKIIRTFKVYRKYCNNSRKPVLVNPSLDVKKNLEPLMRPAITILPEGVVLDPGKLYLASTVEQAGSDYYVPIIEGRSSLARLGLRTHQTGGFGDLGYKQQWTLELDVVHSLRIYPGIRICQVYFMAVKGERKLYDGKYKNAVGVEPSQAWKDLMP